MLGTQPVELLGRIARRTRYHVFVGETCDYELTTTTAEGERAAYQAQFDVFLNSFVFVD